jgi:hypothetical protein
MLNNLIGASGENGQALTRAPPEAATKKEEHSRPGTHQGTHEGDRSQERH